MTHSSSSRRGFLVAGGVGALGLVGGMAVQSTTSIDAGPAAGEGTPSTADIGFCTDMTVHHVQALAMCQRVLGRDTGDPVQAAAAEVLQTQAIEIGTMRAWLTDWGRSTTAPATAMAWMGMNDGDGVAAELMPGLATAEELSSLSTTNGRERGRRWIELMRAHHVGGVAMAEAALDLVSLAKVGRLAQTQVTVQTFEIEQYDVMLATSYA